MSLHGLRAVAAGAVVFILFSIVGPARAEELDSQPLTLELALQEAFTRSPILKSQRAAVAQAEGRLLTAETYPFNPEIELEGASRSAAGESDTDYSVSVSQEIELGGKRHRRVTQASAELEGVKAQLLRIERLLAAQVRAAFTEALRVRELLVVEHANTELARSLAAVARKRFEAGAVAQMEVNLALVQVGRAERDLHLAQGEYEVARGLLAEILGLDPANPPIPLGELEFSPREVVSLAELLDSAITQRADLAAFRSSLDAARARIEVSRREVVPNLGISAFSGREEGTDRINGLGVALRIPLFNRNRGAIAVAQAAEVQILAETQGLEIQIRQELSAALARYRAATQASMNLQRQVLGSLHENLALLQRSFESGKTGWSEVLVFRREFVDVQRDYIETLTLARLADIELDLATGVVPTILREDSQP